MVRSAIAQQAFPGRYGARRLAPAQHINLSLIAPSAARQRAARAPPDAQAGSQGRGGVDLWVGRVP